MKIFAWKAYVNGLPTMENMNIRGITNSRTCPICGSEPENITHAILRYDFTTQVWNLWAENPLRASQNSLNFQDSAMLILTQKYTQDLETFFAVAWAIWYISLWTTLFLLYQMAQATAKKVSRLGIWQKAQWKTIQVLLIRTFPIS